jgi:hypothetical protein
MDLNAVVEELATRLDTITGLRVHSEPPGTIDPPAAVIAYPDITYDATYGRGMDRLELPIVLAVGRISDRISRKQVLEYVQGSGASSVKAVVESGTYTAFDTVRVASVVFDVITIAAVDYLAATFTLDIAGQGA